MRKIERESHGYMNPGQDLVMAGYAGLKGSRILAEERKEVLLEWLSGDYIDSRLGETEARAVQELEPEFYSRIGATEWEPVGKGGILAALWNISGAYETGIWFALRKIPVRQVTIEICERLDLNPYRLLSDGMLLVTDHGEDLVKRLEQEQIDSAVIGKVMSGIKRLIDTGEGTAFLDRPREDELNRVLPGYINDKISE